MRTRPPQPGSIIADIAAYLSSAGEARIAEIHEAVNVRRQKRELPSVSRESIRGALNSNKGQNGHGSFKCVRRGVYKLAG